MKQQPLVLPIIGNEWEHLAVTRTRQRWPDPQSQGARHVLQELNRLVFPSDTAPTTHGVGPPGGYWGASADLLPLPNGGAVYIDLEQPEVTSPETLDPREAYLHLCATEYLVAQAAAQCAEETFVWLMNRSRKPRNQGFVYRAGHINVQVPRDYWTLLTDECFATVLRVYVPFLTAAAVLLGSGAVGDDYDDEAFLCGQRLEAVETIFPSHETTCQRTMSLNLRGNRETLNADTTRTRNHCIGPHDTTVSPTQELRIALVQAATYALLRPLPARPHPDLSLRQPLLAAATMNRDPWQPVPLNDGRALSALDLAEAGLEVIADVLSDDEHAATALPRWRYYDSWLRHTVDALRRHELLDSGAEWAAKRVTFEEADNQTARELDVLWHQIESALFEPDGQHLARALGHAPSFTPGELQAALAAPPAATRAYLRGHVTQRCIAEDERLQMCDWDGLNLPRRRSRLALPTPEDCSHERLGDLAGLSLDEILAGPAEPYRSELSYAHRYRTQHHVRHGGKVVSAPTVHNAGAAGAGHGMYPMLTDGYEGSY
jgi:hypothetical protein